MAFFAAAMMAGQISTLIFSGYNRAPWQHLSAAGQSLGTLAQTPIADEPDCYGMGQLEGSRIWAATEKYFYVWNAQLHRSGGVATVEQIAGSSLNHLYRIVRGDRLRTVRPKVAHAVRLEEIDYQTWQTTRAWDLPGEYLFYGRGHLAVDPEERIAYFSKERTSGTIHRLNLHTGELLPDLVQSSVSASGILALGDDVIVGYTDGAARLSRGGALVYKYARGPVRAAQGLIAAGSTFKTFWVQGHEEGADYTTLYEFDLETGAVRQQWNTPVSDFTWDGPFVDPPNSNNLVCGNLIFSGLEFNSWRMISMEDGTQKGEVPNTPLDSGGASAIGILDNGKIWIAAGGFFWSMNSDFTGVTGGTLAVGTVAGSDGRFIYRLTNLGGSFTVNRIVPDTWTIRNSWTITGLTITSASNFAFSGNLFYISVGSNVYYFKAFNGAATLIITGPTNVGGIITSWSDYEGFGDPDYEEIIVGFTDAVRRYHGTGVLISTYSLGVSYAGLGLLAKGKNQADTFWLLSAPQLGGRIHANEIEVGSGTIVTDFELPEDGFDYDGPFVAYNSVNIPAGSIAFGAWGAGDVKFFTPTGTELVCPAWRPARGAAGNSFRQDMSGAAGYAVIQSGGAGPGWIDTACGAYDSDYKRGGVDLIDHPAGEIISWDDHGFWYGPEHGSIPSSLRIYKHQGSATGTNPVVATYGPWPALSASTDSVFFSTFAVSPDGAFAYFVCARRLSDNFPIGHVWKLALDGSGSATLIYSTGEGTTGFSIITLSNGNIIIGGLAIIEITPSGSLVTTFTNPSDPGPGFDGAWITNGLGRGNDFWASWYPNSLSPDGNNFAVRIAHYNSGVSANVFEFMPQIDTTAYEYYEFDGDVTIVQQDIVCVSMACPDPCEGAGIGEPYAIMALEGTDVLIVDRALTTLTTISSQPGERVVGIIAETTDAFWVLSDDGTGGSILRFYRAAEGTVLGSFTVVQEREVTVVDENSAPLVIGSLEGRRGIALLDCNFALTHDRTTGELIEICLPNFDKTKFTGTILTGTATVNRRYSLAIEKLDFQLAGPTDIIYIDGAAVKQFSLKTNTVVKTVTTAPGPIMWLTLLSDNSFLAFGGTFLTHGPIYRFKRTGALAATYTYDQSQQSLGLYNMAGDIETDICDCGNKKDGLLFLPGKAPPFAVFVPFITPETAMVTGITLPDVTMDGDGTASALALFNVIAGSSFADTTGSSGDRSFKLGACPDEIGLTTVSPNPGCTPVGVGFVPEYTGPSGVVPACPDPVEDENLFGKREIFFETEINHAKLPFGPSEVFRYALVSLDDEQYKEGRIKSIGDVTQAMSDFQGNMESADVNIFIMDHGEKPIGSRVATRSFARDEVIVQARSQYGRERGLAPRRFGRGVCYGESYGGEGPVANITATDPIFIEGGSFGPDKKFPQWGVPLTHFTLAPKDLATLPMPVIIGEVSDNGAMTNGVSAEKGMCPWRYLGTDNLGTGPGGEPWGSGLVCLFAIYKVTGVYGSDLGGMNLYGRNATVTVVEAADIPDDEEGGAAGSTETTTVYLDELLVSVDLSRVPTDGTAGIILFTETGRVEATITGVSNTPGAKSVTINGSVDPTVAQNISWYIATTDYVPRRVKIDLTTRNGVDCMVPKWSGFIKPNPYEEFTSVDGDYRLTMMWFRGPLLAAHLAGEVTIAFNAIGVEDRGDGSGTPITDYFTAMNWLWDNMFHIQSQKPRGPGGLWPQTKDQVPQWADGWSKTKSSSFTAAQVKSRQLFPGGYKIHFYAGEDTSIRDIAQLLNDNAFCQTYQDEYGRMCVDMVDTVTDTSGWVKVTHENDVMESGSVKWWRELRQAMNYLKAGCHWDPEEGKFREDDLTSVDSDAIAENGGIKRYSKHYDFKCVGARAQAQHVLDRIRNLMARGVKFVTINGMQPGIWDIPLGSGILFNSPIGPMTGGFIDRPLLLISKKFRVQPHLVDALFIDLGVPEG